jgi:hypothetical protein
LCNLLFNSVAMTSYTTMFMNIEVALYTLGKFHSFMEYNSFLHMIGFNLQNSYSWVFERCVLRNASIGILITECTYTMLHGSHITRLSNFWGHHHIWDLAGTQLSLCGLWIYFWDFVSVFMRNVVFSLFPPMFLQFCFLCPVCELK